MPTKAQLEAARKHKQEKTVRTDIHRIEEVISSNDYNQVLALHRDLDGKYQYCIADWGKGLWGYNREFGFDYNGLDLDSLRENLVMMKPKLQAFMHGWNAANQSAGVAVNVPDVNVTVNNTVTINLTFEEARAKIEDMTALSREQTDEILERIDELEKISKEVASRKKKWEKVKPIISFALDKGADVAIAILSLVMQMNLGV